MKCLDKDKKCPVKMWKIANRLNEDLKEIYNYDTYKASYGKESLNSSIGIVLAVNDLGSS